MTSGMTVSHFRRQAISSTSSGVYFLPGIISPTSFSRLLTGVRTAPTESAPRDMTPSASRQRVFDLRLRPAASDACADSEQSAAEQQQRGRLGHRSRSHSSDAG